MKRKSYVKIILIISFLFIGFFVCETIFNRKPENNHRIAKREQVVEPISKDTENDGKIQNAQVGKSKRKTENPSVDREKDEETDMEDVGLLDDNRYEYEAITLEDIKEVSLTAAMDIYAGSEYADISFERSRPAESLYAKSYDPEAKGTYITALRDQYGELTAYVHMSVADRDDEKKFLNVSMIEPYPPAYHNDPGLEKKHRESNKYPLKDDFPRIDAVSAKDILDDYLDKKGINTKDTIVQEQGFAILSADDGTGDKFEVDPKFPFYEYSVNDEKYWVNIDNGTVIDLDRLFRLEAEYQKEAEQIGREWEEDVTGEGQSEYRENDES